MRIEKIDLDGDYEIMEQGITEGEIRAILGTTDAEKESESFINGIIVVNESNHDGALDGENSYFWVDEGTSVMALKYGEGEGTIIRIRENEVAPKKMFA